MIVQVCGHTVLCVYQVYAYLFWYLYILYSSFPFLFKEHCTNQENAPTFLQLHAEYDNKTDEYVHHRVAQAFQTSQMIRFVRQSDDVLVFAGDFNCAPTDIAYRIVKFYGCLIDSYSDSPVKVSH